MPVDGSRPSGAPDPAVRAVRAAVRAALAALPAAVRAAPPLIACSGGADSVALAAAARHLRPDVRAAVVDHGLQPGSAAQAAAAVALLERLGVPAAVHRVHVTGPGGVEAAARRARYAALAAARPAPESAVLLGHTLDDQAETVLLGLGRGSGPRSIAGMREWHPPWLRPLLGVARATTAAACAALDLPVWQDPHNADGRFTRVRLRREVLPLLEEVLGGGVAAALARTAAQLREDGEHLDALAARLLTAALPAPAPANDRHPRTNLCDERAARPGGVPPLAVTTLAAAHPAVRRRALRRWLLEGGVAEITDGHLRAVDDLVGRWRGQGGVALPGELVAMREGGRLLLRPAER